MSDPRHTEAVLDEPARRFWVGAEVVEGGVHFRVWAPARQHVYVHVDDNTYRLAYFYDNTYSILVPEAKAGSRYGFSLDDDDEVLADPASRWQPDGPHGLSAVTDDTAFQWQDGEWRGLSGDQIFYQMQVGTWAGAMRELPYLAELGITAIELMPVADVLLWAPTHLYGTPDDFRRFVDAAHAAGIGVILDVVYDHLGPDGNHLLEFSPDYFTDRYENERGDAINFDGPRSGPVRDFITDNAAYWIRDFHLDGLRVAATQSMYDLSREHVLTLLSRRARKAAGERSILLIAENEPQDVRVVQEYGFDALWNDDFHHSARVALTGNTDADYRGTPQEFVSMARHGFLYQGQWSTGQKQHRGTPSRGLPRRSYVWYLQDHDQVAPAALRAMTALLLLGPAQPMLFQGQELAAPALHRELIALRRSDRVFSDTSSYDVEGAVLSGRAFLLRYVHDDGDDRLIVVNLGEALILSPVPEPLLAPPRSRHWELLWSSEEPRYDGEGVTPPEVEGGWHFQAASTVVLAAKEGERRVSKERI